MSMAAINEKRKAEERNRLSGLDATFGGRDYTADDEPSDDVPGNGTSSSDIIMQMMGEDGDRAGAEEHDAFAVPFDRRDVSGSRQAADTHGRNEIGTTGEPPMTMESMTMGAVPMTDGYDMSHMPAEPAPAAQETGTTKKKKKRRRKKRHGKKGTPENQQDTTPQITHQTADAAGTPQSQSQPDGNHLTAVNPQTDIPDESALLSMEGISHDGMQNEWQNHDADTSVTSGADTEARPMHVSFDWGALGSSNGNGNPQDGQIGTDTMMGDMEAADGHGADAGEGHPNAQQGNGTGTSAETGTAVTTWLPTPEPVTTSVPAPAPAYQETASEGTMGGYHMGNAGNMASMPSSTTTGMGVAITAHAGGYGMAGSDYATTHAETDMEDVEIPEWASGLYSKLKASVAHAFILSGNIRDYMVRDVSIRDGIISMLDPNQDRFDVIACYDQAHGITFDLGDRFRTVSKEEYKRRFLDLVRQSAQRKGMTVRSGGDGQPPTDPVELFTLIADMFEMPVPDEQGAKVLLFVDHADLLVPDGATVQMTDDENRLVIVLSDLCRSYQADRGGSCVIMMTDALSQVNATIRDTASRTDLIAVPYPRIEERRDFIEHILDIPEHRLSDGRQIFECQDGVDDEYLAINTAGLSCYQIEDIVLRALADDVPISAKLVKDRKSEIIKNDYNDVLEVMDPSFGFESLGGMDQIKRFFKEELIEPIHSGILEAVPQGVLLMGGPGTGKSTLYKLKVHYYDKQGVYRGTKKIGELNPGEYVCDIDGYPTQVTGIFPQGKLPVYDVVLEDGRHVECSADHVWHVARESHGRMKWEDMTVTQMLHHGKSGIYDPGADGSHPRRSKFSIPMNGIVQMPEQPHRLPPYVIGCFLGDGCCTETNLTLSSNDEELVAEVARQLHASGYHNQAQSHSWTFYMNPDDPDSIQGMPKDIRRTCFTTEAVFRDLPELRGYAKDKRIPHEYMVGSEEQRWELVRGLMDTDGSILSSKRARMTFSSTSRQLIDDFRVLLFTLGIKNTLSVQDRRTQTRVINGRTYERKNVEYTVNILCPNELKPKFFKLRRKKDIADKAAQVIKRRDYSRVSIAAINELGYKDEMVCIKVDDPRELFLIGNDCVVTHNTVLVKAVARESGMNCVAMNMGHVFSDDAGQAELNLDRALDCAMSMQPTIIFIDEIDEALPKRHANTSASGVNNRINKRLLEFFADTSHRGKVVILAATNYPEKIDAAFKRAGRFDKRLPMFAPDGYDRIRIIKINAQKAAKANINKSELQYQVSCLLDPDTVIVNPFKNLKQWIESGNRPTNEGYVGNQSEYRYVAADQYGREQHYSMMLPDLVIDVLDKPTIPLWEFYKAADIILEGRLAGRQDDSSTFSVESDEEYYARIDRTIAGLTEIFGDDPENAKVVSKRLQYYDKRYKPFFTQTERMTGAELDVVVQKAITLYRQYKKKYPDRVEKLIARKVLQDDHDIPFSVLYDACCKTTNATADIKSMEDMALINTSDMDFIPDAAYGTNNAGEVVSYRSRQEELRLKSDRGE